MIPDLSIVVPAYNEARRLPATLRTIDSYFSEGRKPLELIVVDDGSNDNTAAVAEGFRETIPYIRVIRMEKNRGKGAAVREGVLSATGGFVLFSDADLSTPIEEWEPFRRALEAGSDVVIGVRTHPEARVEKKQPFYRRFLGKAFNRVIRLFLGIPCSDTQCGFKAFRKHAAKEIFSRCRTEGFAFDVEVLLLAKRMGYAIREIPVRWINDADSRVSMARHGFAILREVVRIRRRLSGM